MSCDESHRITARGAIMWPTKWTLAQCGAITVRWPAKIIVRPHCTHGSPQKVKAIAVVPHDQRDRARGYPVLAVPPGRADALMFVFRMGMLAPVF